MYQVKNCRSTAENIFKIFFEETRWTLDEGIIGWKTKKDCPLEFTSANSERHIATLNRATIREIISDYKYISRKYLAALSSNSISASKYGEKRDWCYHKWIEFETLFDENGWSLDVSIPDLFKFSPSSNYRTITMDTSIIHLSPTQAKVIKILHYQFLNGNYSLSTEEIIRLMSEDGHKTEATKISQIFAENKSAKELLIKEVGRGRYSLNIPPI